MRIFNYTIPTKQKEGMRALVISDLHYASLYDNPKLIDILIELEEKKYDAIFIVGDIIDSTKVLEDEYSLNFLLNFIKDLGSIAPTYIAYGDHDIAYLSEQMNKKNYRLWVLDNKTFYQKFLNVVAGFPNVYVKANTTQVIKDNYTVSIINPSVEQAINSINGKKEILEKALIRCNFLKALREDTTNTLLCYDPRTTLYLHSLGYLNTVDLSISAYTHNGYTQLKALPIARILDIFGATHKGIVPEKKTEMLKHFDISRGKFDFYNGMSMIINPAITSIPESKGSLHKLNKLFYEGASSIDYVPNEEMKRERSL